MDLKLLSRKQKKPPEGGKNGQGFWEGENMKLRYYAAFTTGALVLILTVGALWFFTHLQLHDIAFIATIAYHSA